MKQSEKIQTAIARQITKDLVRIQRLVARGVPTDEEIAAYSHEVAELAVNGYLKTVCHGFKRGHKWLLAIQMLAAPAKNRAAVPGDFYCAMSFPNSLFSSYLAYSEEWEKLPQAARENYQSRLGVKREKSRLPRGTWDPDVIYNFAAVSLERKSLQPIISRRVTLFNIEKSGNQFKIKTRAAANRPAYLGVSAPLKYKVST